MHIIIVYQSASGSTCTVSGVQQDGETDDEFAARLIADAVPPDATEVRAVDAATFVPPPPPPVPPIPPTPREWLLRLSQAKQLAIITAGQSSPATQLWLTIALGANFIDVASDEVKAGVAAFVSAGVIDANDQALLLAP